MNLYLISQDVNDGYDTYDSAVVCSESESDARMMHPGGINGMVQKSQFGVTSKM